jgi:CheY-like chemotaxis protein
VYDFIIIDDNKIDLLIARKAISASAIETGSILEFGNASNAIEFVKSYHPENHTIMLIDIQMPVMNGFAFMDEFQKIPEEKRAHFTCMYLTSSSNDLDKLRADKYTDIKSFINKPLTSVGLEDIFKSLNL